MRSADHHQHHQHHLHHHRHHHLPFDYHMSGREVDRRTKNGTPSKTTTLRSKTSSDPSIVLIISTIIIIIIIIISLIILIIIIIIIIILIIIRLNMTLINVFTIITIISNMTITPLCPLLLLGIISHEIRRSASPIATSTMTTSHTYSRRPNPAKARGPSFWSISQHWMVLRSFVSSPCKGPTSTTRPTAQQ